MFNSDEKKLLFKTFYNKTLNGYYFNICGIHNFAEEVLNIKVDKTTSYYKYLHPFHCVDFKDMTSEIHNKIIYYVDQIFLSFGFDSKTIK